jgi:hypothetical protein
MSIPAPDTRPRRYVLLILGAVLLFAGVACGGKKVSSKTSAGQTIPVSSLQGLISAAVTPNLPSGFTDHDVTQALPSCRETPTPAQCLPSPPRRMALYANPEGDVLDVEVVSGRDAGDAAAEYQQEVKSYATISQADMRNANQRGGTTLIAPVICDQAAAPSSDKGCLWKQLSTPKLGDEAIEYEDQSGQGQAQHIVLYRRGSVVATVYVSLHEASAGATPPLSQPDAWRLLDTVSGALDTQIQAALK